MKIGIWGLYDKGNFGDDLMAVMFANYLKNNTHEVIVYNASEFLAKEIDVKSESNLDSFVSSCDLIMIGGGGMLVNNPYYKIFLKKTEFQFEYSFYKLLKSLKKYNKKIIPISIGGGNSNYLNNPFKKEIFDEKFTHKGSVRLISDLKALNNSLFVHIPDVVLSASHIMPINRIINKKPKILLNLKVKNASGLIDSLKTGGYFERFDIYSFGSHAESHSHFSTYEYKLDNKHLTFKNIKEALSIISSSDLIISSKLHVGVAGLSYNIPFVSFKGPEKAKLFLNEAELNDYICTSTDEVLRLLNFSEINNDLIRKISFHRKNSEKHFDLLETLIKT